MSWLKGRSAARRIQSVKYPMAPLGIKTTIFQLVAQCLNQQHNCGPLKPYCIPQEHVSIQKSECYIKKLTTLRSTCWKFNSKQGNMQCFCIQLCNIKISFLVNKPRQQEGMQNHKFCLYVRTSENKIKVAHRNLFHQKSRLFTCTHMGKCCSHLSCAGSDFRSVYVSPC
jgi:hypothetical protein